MGRKGGGGGDAGGGRSGTARNVVFTRVVPKFLVGLTANGLDYDAVADETERAAVAGTKPATKANDPCNLNKELAALRRAGFLVDADDEGNLLKADMVEGKGAGEAGERDSTSDAVHAAFAARAPKRGRAVGGILETRDGKKKHAKRDKAGSLSEISTKLGERNAATLSFGNDDDSSGSEGDSDDEERV
jgi:hypothetical protein